MPVNLNQGVILHLLDMQGILDVVATSPTRDRETRFNAVRVPLQMGLLGYRMMLIRPEDEAEFNLIDSPQELKSRIACQGEHWPDSDIMETSGYQILRLDSLDAMFDALAQGRCDYFPRGITEGYAELAHYNRGIRTHHLWHSTKPYYIILHRYISSRAIATSNCQSAWNWVWLVLLSGATTSFTR